MWVGPPAGPQECTVVLIIRGGRGPGWIERQEASWGLKAKSRRNQEAVTHPALPSNWLHNCQVAESGSVVTSIPRTFGYSGACKGPHVACEREGSWASDETCFDLPHALPPLASLISILESLLSSSSGNSTFMCSFAWGEDKIWGKLVGP